MSDAAIRKRFTLVHDMARTRALDAVRSAPAGYSVTVAPPTRSVDQNAKFHALCGDIALSGLEWAGKARSLAEWKVLLVSGHAAATKEGFEIVPGLEGEFVNVRESTASMTKARSASLIEYTLAFMADNGITPGDD